MQNTTQASAVKTVVKPGMPAYKLTDIFPVYGDGIITGRDHLCIRDSVEEMYRTVKKFSSLPVNRARKVFKLPPDTRDWHIKLAQKDIRESSENEVDKKKIVPILYRPFDIHYTYYTGKSHGFLCMPRPEIMGQMLKENIGLISVRQVPEGKFNHCFAADTIIESRVTTSNKGICYVFPLYFYPGANEKTLMRVQPANPEGNELENEQVYEERQINIHPELLEILKGAMNIKNNLSACGELTEQVFFYIYAVLYSPIYREANASDLKIDFPVIPFTCDHELFIEISKLGQRLVWIHLMKSSELTGAASRFEIKGNNRVEKVNYVTPRQLLSRKAFKKVKTPAKRARIEEGRLYINEKQYFSGIKPTVWEYILCGYPILRKWLKMRKGRELCLEEIRHFIRMVRCIELTMEYQEKIDRLFKHLR